MDKYSLLSFVGTFTVFVSLLLAFFLFTVKTNNKLGNCLLACHFVLVAIDLSGFFIYKYINQYLDVEIFRWTLSYLSMPLFYLYSLTICYTNFKLQPKHLLHIIPFIIINFVFVPRFYLGNATAKIGLIQNLSNTPERIFMEFAGEVQFVFYIIAIFILLKKYREIYWENYTNASTATYKWLFQVTVVFIMAHSFVIVKSLLEYTAYKEAFVWANVLVGFIALSVLCWLVLQALYQPELFRGVDSTLPLVKDLVPVENSMAANVQTENEVALLMNETKIASLQQYMLAEEPFLDASLSIQQLAGKINMPVKDLSILINHQMGQHFFDFVNSYRIQKAMAILKDPAKKDHTVQEIFYEVGFNSKSSFNTAFKKYTNQTPTAFKNSSTSAS